MDPSFPYDMFSDIIPESSQASQPSQIQPSEVPKPHACPNCSLKFAKILDLDDHIKAAHCKCYECDSSFGRLKDLSHHAKTEGHLSFGCDHCAQRFMLVQQIFAHARNTTCTLNEGYAKEAFWCDVCVQPYASKFGVRAHAKNHCS